MTYYSSAGTRLTKATMTNVTDPVANPDVLVEFTEDVYQSFTQDGGGFEAASRLAFAQGEVRTQAEVDGLFKTATFTSITPTGGAAAGGTPVTIKGDNFSGASGATLGGTALTSFKVVNNTTITGTTGAHAAGAVALVVADDAGNLTANNAFTYA